MKFKDSAPFHHKIDLPHGLSTHLPEQSFRQVEFSRLTNALKLDQIDIKHMNIEDLYLLTGGEFDISFCFGILYHLENPYCL